MARKGAFVYVIRRLDNGTYYRVPKVRYSRVRRSAWTPNVEKAKHYWQGFSAAERYFKSAVKESDRPDFEVVELSLVDWTEFEMSSMSVPMCGLCGSTGRLDHEVPDPTGNAVKTYRMQGFCICPNGRALKEQEGS